MGVLQRMWGWLIGAPPKVLVPRNVCQRVVLEVKGMARRQIGPSIALQLRHLTGVATLGYAWKLVGERAHVWYWPEAAPKLGQPDQQPCPEMLMRPPLADGLYLLACTQGFEATHLAMGAVNRSRWFSEPPSIETWTSFVRDAGLNPNLNPVKAAQSLALQKSLQPGWLVQSSRVHPLALKAWLALAVAIVVGALLVGLLSYQIKLNQRIAAVQLAHANLSRESAVALGLQAQIDDQKKNLGLAALSQPKTIQIKLMAQLAAAGFFDESTKVTLQEWEYRNNRVRIQFAVPAEGFELGKFLASIERLGLLNEVRLLPGTPAQTVAIQASLAQDALAQPNSRFIK